MEYTKENIKTVLELINKLYEDRGISLKRAHTYLENSIPDDMKYGVDIIFPKKTTYHNCLKGKYDDLRKYFNIEAFNLLIIYLESNGIVLDDRTVDKITSLHPLISEFARISKDDDEHARKMLPGYYRTYRPAIAKPGYVVVGLLHIFENKQHKSLQTYEFMRYPIGEEGIKLFKHRYTGMAWYSRGHYVILTTDNNTKFIQTIILRSNVADTIEEKNLEGTYLTVTKKGGPSMICSKILLSRIPYTPKLDKRWREYSLYTRGYKHIDAENPRFKVSRDIWDKINPDKPENMIRI